MKNAILPQVSSQIYSFGCSETAGFSTIPSQTESELNVFSGDGYCIDSNLYTNQDNLGGVLAFCSESQINYQSEPPSSLAVKRLGYPSLGLDHGFSLPGYGNVSREALFHGKRLLSVQENVRLLGSSGGIFVLMVSPYGKTDTASVLQEACISIKALQDQIWNLCHASHGHSEQKTRDGNEARLHNRGLCLVPVSLSQTVADQEGFVQSNVGHHDLQNGVKCCI